VNGRTRKTTSILALMPFATMLGAQVKPYESALRKIIQDQTTAWNKGDAEANSQLSPPMADSQTFQGCSLSDRKHFEIDMTRYSKLSTAGA
jgi:hypothetical protein